VKRPRGFFRANGNIPAEVTLRVERPDGFELLTDVEWTAKLEEAVRREDSGSVPSSRRSSASCSANGVPSKLLSIPQVKPSLSLRLYAQTS
jgi:hypothetical protein